MRLWDARFRASGLHSFAGHWFFHGVYTFWAGWLWVLVGSADAGTGSACQGRMGWDVRRSGMNGFSGRGRIWRWGFFGGLVVGPGRMDTGLRGVIEWRIVYTPYIWVLYCRSGVLSM